MSPAPARSRPVKRFVRYGLLIFAALCVLAAAGWFCLPAPPPLLGGVTYSRGVADSRGKLLRLTLTTDDKYRIRTSLGQISPDLMAATLCYEDRHFWQHPGVNPWAALRSAWHFCLTRTPRGGASTISMQLARLTCHLNTRTVTGKLRQMLRALEIERHYNKSQILEAYFNLAPYGRNIEGAGAASLLYFGKPAAQLTLHEAVALSVIPQSPRRRTPRLEQANAALLAAENRLLDRLRPGANDPLSRDFDFRLQPAAPAAAPHFVRALLAEHPAQSEITSTLDSDLQRLLQRRIASYLEARSRLGLTNAAAMLVDTRSMEVLAEVGSADFFNAEICGQVDGTRSRRSPGSTLKPFIYALALDQGLIQPLSIVIDSPHRFGNYAPENFDGDFAGPITATDALVRSRNVPAVWLASQLAHPTLYELLRRGGVCLPRDEAYYGLALPLGGGEVTMEELVRLYAALANGGRMRAVQRTLPHAEPAPGLRLFSPEAAFLTLDMLARNPRPGLGDDSGAEGVAWKTGTSRGFRDAWSLAVFDHYVLAVWIGNFDGRGNPAFVGRTCAAPLLFQIIDAMRAQGRAHLAPRLPPAGANLQRIDLCAVSGQLPTAACSHHTTGWFIPGVSPITACQVHREVLIDVQTGLRVPLDDGTRQLRRQVFEFWPSELMALFDAAGLPRRRPPPFLPDTDGGLEQIARGGHPPQILSPRNAQTYVLDPANPSGAIALRAQTDTDATRLYWFADRAFLGTTSVQEPFPWRPSPGAYRITALDDQGRSATAAAQIESGGRSNQ
jgi:penicillin-binding protein 1C